MQPYVFHITLYDAAFFAVVVIGLTFTLLLWFTESTNSIANRFLASALVTMIFWIASPLWTDIGLVTRFLYLSWLAPQFSLAVGPLVYFYVRKITQSGYRFQRTDFLHFIPLLLPSVAVLSVKKNLYLLIPALQLAPFISFSIYLYWSYKLIPRFYHEPGSKVIDRRRHGLWRFRRLLACFSLSWLFWIPYIAISYFDGYNLSDAQSYYPVFLFLAALVIWLSVVAFSWFEVRLTVPVAVVPKPSASTELTQKGSWLKGVMKTGLFYQDAELSLSSLAEKLDIQQDELSRIINTALQMNFNDFINEYRVRDVIVKMQDPAYAHITLPGISFESGFNSKTSFNRIFKEITGKNPTEFKNELKKERPYYNLWLSQPVAPVVLNHESSPGASENSPGASIGR